MGPLSTPGVGGGPPSRRSGGKPGLKEPALERAFGGQRVIRKSAAQHHADQARSPCGMLAAKPYGGLHDRHRRLRCRGPATVIGGDQGGLAFLTEPANQAADGARGEAEGLSDGGAILAVLRAAPDGLAHGTGIGRGMGCSPSGVRAVLWEFGL
jgi:hypothetical protein